MTNLSTTKEVGDSSVGTVMMLHAVGRTTKKSCFDSHQGQETFPFYNAFRQVAIHKYQEHFHWG